MKTVKEACEEWGRKHGITVTPEQLLVELLTENKKLRAELEKHRWMLVSEKLPERYNKENEYSHHVFCTDDRTGHLKVDQYLTEKQKWASGRTNWTHWKPIILPEKSTANTESGSGDANKDDSIK